VTLAGNATVRVDADSLRINGANGGSGGLTKIGAGTLVVGGSNNYAGSTTINAGTLSAGAANVIPNTSAVTVAAGATLDLEDAPFSTETIGSLAGAGNVELGANNLQAGGNNSSTTFSGAISGAGGFTKSGTGVLTLSGNNTYTSNTTIESGTLRLAGGNAISNMGAVGIGGGATLDLNNTSETVGSLFASGNVTLGSGTLTTGVNNLFSPYSGIISGTGSVVKVGTGTWTLSGANTYSGTTDIQQGILNLLAEGRIGNPNLVTLASAAELIVDGTAAGNIFTTSAGGGPTVVAVELDGQLRASVASLGTVHVRALAGNDTFNIQASGGGRLLVDGQADSDSYLVELSALNGPVNINDTGSSGNDSLTINAAGPGTLIVADSEVTLLGPPPKSTIHAGIEDVSIIGVDEADEIVVAVNPDTISEDLQGFVTTLQESASGNPAAEIVLPVTSELLVDVLDAVASLEADADGPVVTVVVNLADGNYAGQSIDVPAGVRLVIDGTNSSVVFEGASPALTVSAGEVIVNGVSFVNATDAPTILVTGGSLVLRDSDVHETTGGSQAAIEITGGTVDLGTAELPGENTFDVSGPGELIRNLSNGDVFALGNVFQVDGVTLTNGIEIEAEVFHGYDLAGLGVVNYGSVSLFVAAGDNLQSVIDSAPPNATIYVAPGVTGSYDAGTKLLTIAFENGPTVSQHADDVIPGLRTLTITGTPANDIISFTSGPGAGVVNAAIGGVPTGKFKPTGRLIAYGEDGNDEITVDDAIMLAAILEGGNGDDELTAGAGDDLLLGGSGSDRLTGASGNDFLAGGQEADRIVGSAGHDVLVAGEVASHLTHDDLLLIAQQWAANRTDDGSTSDDVLDEVFGGFDSLTGSSGADWFIVSVNDKVTDFKKNNNDGDVLTLV
jgi:autotransporter-associated beta strand protein